MISLLPKPQNGSSTTPEKYRRRLEEVLGDEMEAAVYSPTELHEPAAALPESPASAANGAPVPDAAGPVSGEPPSYKAGLDLAARQIADTLVGTFAQTVQDLHLRVSADHTRLETATEIVHRLSREVQQVNMDVSSLSPRAEALGLEQAQLNSKLVEIDGRISQQAQASTDRFSALESRILLLGEKLDQLQHSLSQRADSHDEMIFQLRNEVRQPAGMMERLLGTLRGLDLRRESRFPVDETVKLTIDGEPETVLAGRIVDASESGLRLILETPLRPACQVRVEANGGSLAGAVAYCIPNGDKHAVGLRLSQPLRGNGTGPVQTK